MLDKLALRVVEIEPIVVGLDPEILLRVNMQTLSTTPDTMFAQPTRWRTIDRLRHRIIEREVHAVVNPQIAKIVFLYLVNTVTPKSRRVTFV